MEMKEFIWFILIFISIVIWILYENKALKVNKIVISDYKIPKNFDGYRIAQISDFHNTTIGKNNDKVIKLLEECKPDVIVITGDLIDSRNTKVDIVVSFIKKAVHIAPIYYVIGNHEPRVVDEYKELEKALLDMNVTVLHNEYKLITIENQSIQFVGIDDPSTYKDETLFIQDLSKLKNQDIYTILLSHRPEYVNHYAEFGYDLVFSGHAHGGQIRIPFLGGIIAPGQGLFPKYASGFYRVEKTSMVVSRGIGNSLFPFRVNNRPEIVLVEMKSK